MSWFSDNLHDLAQLHAGLVECAQARAQLIEPGPAVESADRGRCVLIRGPHPVRLHGPGRMALQMILELRATQEQLGRLLVVHHEGRGERGIRIAALKTAYRKD